MDYSKIDSNFVFAIMAVVDQAVEAAGAVVVVIDVVIVAFVFVVEVEVVVAVAVVVVVVVFAKRLNLKAFDFVAVVIVIDTVVIEQVVTVEFFDFDLKCLACSLLDGLGWFVENDLLAPFEDFDDFLL